MNSENKHNLIYPEPVSLIITTRNRFESFSKYLEKIIETTLNNPVIIACDDDKISEQKFKKKFGHLKFVQIYNSPYQMENVSLRNWAYTKIVTEKFVYMDDDMEPGNNEWLINAINFFNANFADNIGLVAFKDGIQNGEMAPAGLTTRKFIKYFCNRTLYNPQYVHYFCDTELSLRAKNIKRYAYCENAILLHHHPKSFNDGDEIYKKSGVFWKQDQIVFEDFVKNLQAHS